MMFTIDKYHPKLLSLLMVLLLVGLSGCLGDGAEDNRSEFDSFHVSWLETEELTLTNDWMMSYRGLKLLRFNLTIEGLDDRYEALNANITIISQGAASGVTSYEGRLRLQENGTLIPNTNEIVPLIYYPVGGFNDTIRDHIDPSPPTSTPYRFERNSTGRFVGQQRIAPGYADIAYAPLFLFPGEYKILIEIRSVQEGDKVTDLPTPVTHTKYYSAPNLDAFFEKGNAHFKADGNLSLGSKLIAKDPDSGINEGLIRLFDKNNNSRFHAKIEVADGSSSLSFANVYDSRSLPAGNYTLLLTTTDLQDADSDYLWGVLEKQ